MAVVIIAREQSLAIYVHCAAHCVNLIVTAVCAALTMVHDSIYVVNELGVMCNASGKFQAQLKAILLSDNAVSGRNIKPLYVRLTG